VKSSTEFKSLSFFKALLCHENLSRYRDIAKENNVDNDESDYFVPISGGKEFNNYTYFGAPIKVYNLWFDIALGAEESIPEAINSRINSFNSSDGGSPFILISSDSFTDTDDEAHNSPIAANNSSNTCCQKQVFRKKEYHKVNVY
jgi:hypothetical protein